MAAEEPSNPPALPSLPQYPDLILAAIGANHENGANKSTISRHIEATYGNLPAAHATLLSHNLNKMKQSGQLIMFKNNYLKPDDVPPRRGRGRPPKPKSSPPPDAVVSPPRPRGRPPKPRDPMAPLPEKKSPAVSGRKRGRPRKIEKTTAVVPASSGAPRGRGRPPKVKRL